MRTRLLTFFAAVAAIIGTSLTSTTTTAAASTEFIHLSVYSDYTVLMGTATTHNGHPKIGGVLLTTGGSFEVCDDHADGIYIGGELASTASGIQTFLVDTNGATSGCVHKTFNIPNLTLLSVEIDTGHTIATAVTKRGSSTCYLGGSQPCHLDPKE
jgi:hypothetical protein